jgi:hypothetical protein
MNNEFDLQRVIAGEPIETTGGNPVELIAYRPTADTFEQVVVQLGKHIHTYSSSGHHLHNMTSIRMKSVGKRIDWAKLPVDTILVVNEHIVRYFKEFRDGKLYCFSGGRTSISDSDHAAILTVVWEVQIAQDQPWTVWQGGACPIPDGLEFEYMVHAYPGKVIAAEKSPSEYCWSLCTIYAYRLTGKVLGGYSL